MKTSRTFKDAAIHVLKERGPLHYHELAETIMTAGLVQTDGATPAASLNATLAVDIKRRGKDSAFVRIRPGVFGLRELHEPATRMAEQPALPEDPAGDEHAGTVVDDVNLRVRVPLFPSYHARPLKA